MIKSFFKSHLNIQMEKDSISGFYDKNWILAHSAGSVDDGRGEKSHYYLLHKQAVKG
jgi:hypothetical protein